MPSNTKINPREHAKAFTLRSEKKLIVPTHMVAEKENEPKLVLNEMDSLKEDESKKEENEEKNSFSPPYKPPIPYPRRLHKGSRRSNTLNFSTFLSNYILIYHLLVF